MVKAALQLIGWLLARTPEPLVRGLTSAVGALFYRLVASRRRLMLSNLHHAFPERDAAWRERVARECIRRFVETAFYSLACPYFNESRLRGMIVGGESVRAAFAEHKANPRPVVFCAPHFAHWEMLTTISLLADGHFPEFVAIFRPIDNPAVDAFIKKTRERFGMRLLSRRQGFQEALAVLGRKGCVGVLHDQNAGNRGALSLLFDRVCSTTELPAMMAVKYDAVVCVIYPRYLGFWRAELCVERLKHDGTEPGITIALNRWLEDRLRTDENQCISWLWGHQRWKTQDAPQLRFRLEQKRTLLADELRQRHLPALPRRMRLWIRLPNWLGDVVMVLPLLRAIRRARPDADITLVAKSQFLPFLEPLGLADRLRALPKANGLAYFSEFREARDEFIDCYLLFTNSTRGDLEAWCTGARQRFGIARPGKRRRLLTHRFKLPAEYDEEAHHQLELWTDFVRHFGLIEPLDLTPLGPRAATRGPIALICGSENTPAKRWPVEHWRSLIAAFPGERFQLLGTANDRAITAAVAAGFGDRVVDLAGRTSLPEFATLLQQCRLLISNDTGGMHLANALGTPVIALFGPTNPVRTGPIFAAPAIVLQPPGSSRTGGGALTDLAPTTVIAEVHRQLEPTA